MQDNGNMTSKTQLSDSGDQKDGMTNGYRVRKATTVGPSLWVQWTPNL